MLQWFLRFPGIQWKFCSILGKTQVCGLSYVETFMTGSRIVTRGASPIFPKNFWIREKNWDSLESHPHSYTYWTINIIGRFSDRHLGTLVLSAIKQIPKDKISQDAHELRLFGAKTPIVITESGTKFILPLLGSLHGKISRQKKWLFKENIFWKRRQVT